MKVGVLAGLFQLMAFVFAYTITEGVINIEDQAIYYGEIMTQEIKQLLIDSPKDKLEMRLKMNSDIDTAPHQIVVSISSADNSNLITHYIPVFTVNNEIKLSIPLNKLPEVLKTKSKLLMHLIVADEDPNFKNMNKQLLELLPTTNFQKTASYKSTDAIIGYKPEIHHIFQGEQKQVGSIIPILFIGCAIILFIGLNLSWNAIIGKDLYRSFSYITSTQLSYNVFFLLSIMGFEYNIFQYYLGQSIFTTLFRGFIISLPGIFFGSKVLRYLRNQRLAGKA